VLKRNITLPDAPRIFIPIYQRWLTASKNEELGDQRRVPQTLFELN